MDISGKIVDLLEEFTTPSGKTKFGFVLETVGQYPQKLPFEVWGEEKWQQMPVVVGSNVNVSFDISGREWNGKYFVSLNAWKVVSTDSQQQAVRTDPSTAVRSGEKAPAPTDGSLPF